MSLGLLMEFRGVHFNQAEVNLCGGTLVPKMVEKLGWAVQ